MSIEFIIILFVFVFGLIIGSFLNVVILRYNTGMSIGGRSGCFSCGKKLVWYELIPVVSFIFQKGRCTKCGAKLSWQYPLVEALTAFMFVSIYLKYFSIYSLNSLQNISSTILYSNIFTLVFFWVVWSILIVILVYDMRHKIIPDGLVFAAAGLVFVKIFIDQYAHIFTQATLWMILAGPLLFLPFYLLWKVSDGRWIGLGDGKLALVIGWMVGIIYGISAIVLAFWIGAGVSILLILFHQLKSSSKGGIMKHEIPFAPYLILGLALAYFFQIDIMGIHILLGL